MNTRDAYAQRAQAQRGRPSGRPQAPYGLGTPVAALPARAEPKPAPPVAGGPRHPLADRAMNARLAHCEEAVKGRFDAIAPTLREISALQHEHDFPVRAQQIARARLGYELPIGILEDAWVAGLDLKALYAHCAFQALKAASAQFVRDIKDQLEQVQDARNFFLECGYHAVDISPCADGRLKGLSRYILRLPLTSLTRRKSYAGALFDVETDLRHWGVTELRRYREGVPTTADAGTRYLKIAVYHTSSSDPCHQGCAAHGSNEHKAIEAALERLIQFRQAIENSYCCGASTDLLLIGVDTDTDAIKVHIPDGKGDLSPHRHLDNAELYRQTAGLSADAARAAVYEAIRATSRKDGWGAGQGEPHDGMRRFIANVLINNFSQIEYVADLYGERYPDIGHAERFICVGDGLEEVQMRNVVYYAHLATLEEGVADVDVGVKIFKGLNVAHGLPIPVVAHFRYDRRVPGSRQRAVDKARRVGAAIGPATPTWATGPCWWCGRRWAGRARWRWTPSAASPATGSSAWAPPPPGKPPAARSFRRTSPSSESSTTGPPTRGRPDGNHAGALRAGGHPPGAGAEAHVAAGAGGGKGVLSVACDPVGVPPGKWVFTVSGSAARYAAGDPKVLTDLTIAGIIDHWDPDA